MSSQDCEKGPRDDKDKTKKPGGFLDKLIPNGELGSGNCMAIGE